MPHHRAPTQALDQIAVRHGWRALPNW